MIFNFIWNTYYQFYFHYQITMYTILACMYSCMQVEQYYNGEFNIFLGRYNQLVGIDCVKYSTSEMETLFDLSLSNVSGYIRDSLASSRARHIITSREYIPYLVGAKSILTSHTHITRPFLKIYLFTSVSCNICVNAEFNL